MAYASLGSDYMSLGETSLGAENVRKAYELRSRVSEPENLYIESTYYHYVTGDLEKARQVYELSAQTYPRYAGTPLRLCVLYSELGRYDDALAQILQAIRLDPSRAINYSNLVNINLNLSRFDEARAKAQEAQAKQMDSSSLRHQLYTLAFLTNDPRGMAQQVEWSEAKTGTEDILLGQEADVAASYGELNRAREISRRALALSTQPEKKNAAADYQVRASLREALFGNSKEARLYANAALHQPLARDAQFGAALALALTGDTLNAQRLADDLGKSFPDDTIVRFNYLPVLRAQLALDHGQASKAVEELQAAIPYELGSPGSRSFSPSLYPIYLRGNAYLAAHQGEAAAAEFQKMIDHRGVSDADPVGVLAHLQLARSYEVSGNRGKARSSYQEFLTLWKGADPQIPILKQAKAEYANLK
jgi:tetratricopeptide (TPR) repeat protein